MSTLDLINYYANLLILQYTGKAKALATVQTLVTPVLMPQTIIEQIDGGDALGFFDDLIDGGGAFTVSFDGVIDGGGAEQQDETLPFAVQNGFDLIGTNIAIGKQLDILAKFVGVSRSVSGFTHHITLSDTDLLSLIRMAVVQNSSGSSLATIQANVHAVFGNNMLVFDAKNMQMSYYLATAIGSLDLVQAFIVEGLLPKPMGVQVAAVIYAPVLTKFFGFRTYAAAGFNNEPFNTYGTYHHDWPWLTYADSVLM